MATLEDLTPGTIVTGLVSGVSVEVSSVEWIGADAIELEFTFNDGQKGKKLIYRADQSKLDATVVSVTADSLRSRAESNTPKTEDDSREAEDDDGFVKPSPQIVEICIWRVMSELHRWHPDKFSLIEIHPFGGTYDCVTIRAQQHGLMASFNRSGRLHITNSFRYPTPAYPIQHLDTCREMLGAVDPKPTVERACKLMDLEIPATLPPTSRETLVYRFIAEFLAHAIFRREQWECRNGYLDTSGYGGGVHTEWFERFPGAETRRRQLEPERVFLDTAYRFWFLLRNHEPVICLETSGTAWSTGADDGIDLMARYQKTRRIWSLITLFPSALP